MSLHVETRPTVPAELKGVINIEQATWVRVRRRQPLFRPLLAYMAKHASHSFEVDQVVAQGKQKDKVALTVSGIAGERDEKVTCAMQSENHSLSCVVCVCDCVFLHCIALFDFSTVQHPLTELAVGFGVHVVQVRSYGHGKPHFHLFSHQFVFVFSLLRVCLYIAALFAVGGQGAVRCTATRGHARGHL